MPPAPRKLNGKPWVELGDKKKWPLGRVPPDDPLENTRDHERIWFEIDRLKRIANVGNITRITETVIAGPQPVAFGLAPLLDDFNRANESPITGWTQPLIGAEASVITVAGNMMGVGALWEGTAYWPSSFAANQEAYIDIASGGGGVRVFARMTDPGGANVSGYCVGYDPVDTFPAATFDKVNLYAITNGVYSLLGEANYTMAADGDLLGIRCWNNEISAWIGDSTGANPWERIINVEETTYNSAGYLGAHLYWGDVIDNFYGGETATA